MSDKPLVFANGRAVFGLKELHSLAWLVAFGVVLWMTTTANSQGIKETKDEVRAIEGQVDADHETMTEIRGSVGRLVEDMQAIKLEQVEARKEQTKVRESVQEQRSMLQNIQQTLSAMAGRPPR